MESEGWRVEREEWSKVKERAVELADVMRQLREALETFLRHLEDRGAETPDQPQC